MTVKELYGVLGRLMDNGYADTRVIASCDFTVCRKGTEYEHNTSCEPEHYQKYLPYLNDVYYQSGDIELGFSDEEAV